MNPNQTVTPSGRNYYRLFIYAAVAAGVLLIFSLWAFMATGSAQRDQQSKTDAAVEVAETALTKKLDDKYTELAKKPYKTLKSAESLGGITIKHPRSWSVYLVEDEGGSTPVELYAHPTYVPDIRGENAFGLRLEIISESYDEALGKWDNDISDGDVSAGVVKSNKVIGTRLRGVIDNEKTGQMVLLPLRDKTLLIWTEAVSFSNDFDAILTSLVFNP